MKKTTKPTTTTPATHIRFNERLEAMLAEAAERTGLTKAELVRNATGIGLRYLAAINYDIDGAIFEKAQNTILAQSKPSDSPAEKSTQTRRIS